MSEYKDQINDILSKVVSGDLAKAQNEIGDVLDAKLSDRIDQERVTVAAKYHGNSEESDDNSDTEED